MLEYDNRITELEKRVEDLEKTMKVITKAAIDTAEVLKDLLTSICGANDD